MNNQWQQFLLENGAQFGESPAAGVRYFGAASHPSAMRDSLEKGYVAPLVDLGLMSATGEDAAHFLHNQLTNDVEHLGPAEARLAGYCSPKGRLLATFLMWKSADVIVLQLPREIQAPIQKRLQMFVLRAKVKFADHSDDHVLLGLGGLAASDALRQWFPTLPEAPYVKVEHPDAGTLIRLADANAAPRYQWITNPDYAMAAWPRLLQMLQPAGTAAWHLSAIQAGIPQVVQATQEQFVPQMINFEVIGGVNFKKGCYPGQEIVARSQYLGKLKRRMAAAVVNGDAVAAGMEVFSSVDPEQPCGMIVNAAPAATEGFAVLVEMKTAAQADGTVHLGSAGGPALRFQPLPYSLPDPA